MKKIEITAYGAPEAVAHCIEAPDVGAPGAGEIVFEEIKPALVRAQQGGRSGTVLVLPNGTL